MSSPQSNRLAFAAAKAILDATQPLELRLRGKTVRVAFTRGTGWEWPTLTSDRPIVGLDKAVDGPWPPPVELQCDWGDGAVRLELRLNVWRQHGAYEGHLALQVVTIPSNREIVWINLTKRLDDAQKNRAARCIIPANFALWARPGERSARPLTDALTKAAAEAGLSALAATQFHAFDLELPGGGVRPSPLHASQNLVKTALLKLPFVTRGEDSDIEGNAPFPIDSARRHAAQAPAVQEGEARASPAEAAAGAEPPAAQEPPVSSQENVFYDFILCQNFGPFSLFRWEEMSRINVIVGENDTGKSHLLKLMYAIARGVEDFTSHMRSDQRPWRDVLAEKLVWTFEPEGGKLGLLARRGAHPDEVDLAHVGAILCNENYGFSFSPEASSNPDTFRDLPGEILPQPNLHALYLPPKEVLTSQTAIAFVRDRRMFGFDDTYVDLVRALRPEPVVGPLPDELQEVLESLDDLLGGRVVTDQGKFLFVRGGDRFGMSQTAEGIKKIGILARLIENGELRRNSILFIDEPEVNLHPKAVRALVRMLFNLSRAGVQIFAATHSYFVLKEMEILARERKESVTLCSLARDRGGKVEASFTDLLGGLPETGIGREALAQYDAEAELAMREAR
jgi:hypothetical protein